MPTCSYGERQKDNVLQLRQYPEREGIAYPKPGTPNPKVGLTVLKLSTGSRIGIIPPRKLADQANPKFHNVFWYLQEFLLANFLWMSDTMLVVNWMNRIQNHSIHMRFSFNSVSNLMTKLSDVH